MALAILVSAHWCITTHAQVRLRSATPSTNFRITSPSDFPDGVAGESYTTQVITTANATGTVTCAVTSGSLPAWMTRTGCSFAATSATTAGTTIFTITATDDGPTPDATSSLDVSITIAASGSIPSPWQCTAIGASGGTATESSGTWTISGSGAAFDTADTGYHYCWQDVTGDKQITARVTGCTAPSPQGYGEQCGVRIQADLTQGTANALIIRSSTNDVIAQWRSTAGATTGSTGTTNTHEYVRVVNVGGQLTMWTSPDNVTYFAIQAQAVSVTLGSTYKIGLFVNSNAVGQLTTGTLSTVTIGAPTITGENDYGGYRPEFQGYGADSVGGRGGPYCIVNSLANTGGTFSANGTGTLKDCVAARSGCVNTAATCARTVLFSVSGNIDFSGGGNALFLESPFLTIAGQTAPSPGISLINLYLVVDSPHIVVQHIRIRSALSGTDAVYIAGRFEPVHHVILDHVSIAYGGHEGLGVNAQALGGTNGIYPTNILVWRIINGPNLNPNIPGVQLSSIGSLFIGNPQDAGLCTVAHSYYGHNGNRNPWVATGYQCAIINNLFYNAKTQAGDDGYFGFTQLVTTGPPYGPSRIVYIGNRAIAGADTVSPDGTITVAVDTQSASEGGLQVYLSDNVGPGITGTTADGQWAGVKLSTDPASIATRANTECDSTCYAGATMLWFRQFDFAILAQASVQADVVANSGARPLDRDTVDTDVIADVGAITGSIKLLGSQPAHQSLANNSHNTAGSIPANPTSVASGQTVRTNLEMWLITCAKKVETNSALACVS